MVLAVTVEAVVTASGLVAVSAVAVVPVVPAAVPTIPPDTGDWLFAKPACDGTDDQAPRVPGEPDRTAPAAFGPLPRDGAFAAADELDADSDPRDPAEPAAPAASANATGTHATTEPTPKATARAPIRPTNRALPVITRSAELTEHHPLPITPAHPESAPHH